MSSSGNSSTEIEEAVKQKSNIVKLKNHNRQKRTPVWDLSLSSRQKEHRRKRQFRARLHDIRTRIVITLFVTSLAGLLGYNLYSSPWPITTTLRHWAARPNCDMARLFGLAPSKRGQPGYYPWHDRDNDGIACEVWPKR